MKHEYIQYGCGWSATEGWLNFDASPTLRFERFPLLGQLYTKNAKRFPANVEFGDIVAGLPLSTESCRGIYCSHVLEHLALDDFDRALKNTWSYLERGGTFRLVVPDLEQLARKYLADRSEAAVHRFMEDSCLGKKHRSRGLSGLLSSWLGNSAHLWMWDEKAMAAKLHHYGFVDVRRAAFGDSEDPRFKEIEERGRWDDCLGMQCRKPTSAK